jgi:hypothetical protein
MNKRTTTAFLLAGCSLLAAVPAAVAADPPRKSHRPIGPWAPYTEDDLNKRLQNAADMNLMRDLVDRLLKEPRVTENDKLRNQLRQWINKPDTKKLLDDPDVRQAVVDAALHLDLDKISPEEIQNFQKMIEERRGDANLTDKDVEELRKTVKEKMANDPEHFRQLLSKLGTKANLPLENTDAVDRLKSMPPSGASGPGGPGEKPEPMGDADTPSKAGADARDTTDTPTQQEKPSTLASILLDMILEHANLDDDFVDNVVDWLTNAANGEEGEGGWMKSALGKTIDWVGSLRPGEWLPSDETRQTTSSLFGRLSPPSLSRETSGSSTPAMPAASGFSTGSLSLDMDQLSRVIIWGLALLLLAFASWRLQLWYRGRESRGLPRGWPVRPEAVATRGDLVRAFEYLALLLVGIEAKHRHHLELAERLGGPVDAPEDDRRQAANHLAHLYELARYAPEDELLPETELAAARRNLSYLAGAGAA